jgi:peptide/nickel transport system ATP-binding protein
MLLSIQDLSVTIGATPILNRISLELAPGEILGVVGESGSGKSMTLLSAMRLLPRGAKANGRIVLAGQDLMALSERDMCAVRGARIGMIFQEPMTALNPVQTIGHQVAEIYALHKRLPPREALREAGAHLARMGLDAARVPHDRYPHQLSGGQRQRVVIAMATALAPQVLLADEPTTALDATTQAEILRLLRGLAREQGAGLIFVTHDLAVVAGLADRITIMRQGEIVEHGRAPAVFHSLQHPYSRALLAAATLSPGARRTTPADGGPVAEARDISVAYTTGALLSRRTIVSAVESASLTVARGETLAIVGQSGSGKSTLARAILGVQSAAHGAIRIAGEDLATSRGKALRALRRRVQAVFQDPYGSLDPRQNVEAIVAEPLHLLDRGLSRQERRLRVETMLERVGLVREDADKHPHEFSGGQRQRIAIARALILEPELIVLDEAVSALDVSIRAQIIALLRDLSDKLGIAYLFITHDLAVVRAMADRVLVMQHGRIVEEGTVAEVFAAPKHTHTKELIAASPDLEAALAAREVAAS